MTETVVHRLHRRWCDNKDDDDSGHDCYAGIGVELSMYKPEQHTTGDHPGAVTWEGAPRRDPGPVARRQARRVRGAVHRRRPEPGSEVARTPLRLSPGRPLSIVCP
jgi:hypothetical protein